MRPTGTIYIGGYKLEYNIRYAYISMQTYSKQMLMIILDVPDQGLLCDLLWSDPDKETQGWGENDRGVSYTFGAEVVAKFLYKHDLDLICRLVFGWTFMVFILLK